MKRINIYKVGLVTMVILNLTLIFFMLKESLPERGRGPRKNQGGQIMEKIKQKLMLNEVQGEQYTMMARAHHESMMAINQEQKKLVKAYLYFLKEGDASVEAREGLLEKIKSLEGDKIKLTYEHFEALKSICNEEQLSVFGSVIDEISSVLIRGRQREGGPPPPHGRRP